MLPKETVAEIAKKYSTDQVCVVFPFGIPVVNSAGWNQISLFMTISKKKEVNLRLIDPETHELLDSYKLKDFEETRISGRVLFLFHGEYIIEFDPTYPIGKFHEMLSKILAKLFRAPPKKYEKKFVVEDDGRRNDPVRIYVPINSQVTILKEYAETGECFVRSDVDDEKACGFIPTKWLSDTKRKDVEGYQSLIVDQQKNVLKRMIAVQSYTAQRGDELSIHVNDLINVYEQTEEHWWRGEINGTVGLFPKTFCEEFKEEEKAVAKVTTLADTIILGKTPPKLPPKPSKKPIAPPKKEKPKLPPTSPPKSKPPLPPRSPPKSPPRIPSKPPPNTKPPVIAGNMVNKQTKQMIFTGPRPPKPSHSAPPVPKIDVDEDPGLLSELETRLKNRKHFPAAPLIQLEEQNEQTMGLEEADEDAVIFGSSGMTVKAIVQQYETLIEMISEGVTPYALNREMMHPTSGEEGNKRNSLQLMQEEERKEMVETIDAQVEVLGNLKSTLNENYTRLKQELNLSSERLSPVRKIDRRSKKVQNKFKSIVAHYERLIKQNQSKSDFEEEVERKKKMKEVIGLEEEMSYVGEMIKVFNGQRKAIMSTL